MAPSHYVKQCWVAENIVFEKAAILSSGRWDKNRGLTHVCIKCTVVFLNFVNFARADFLYNRWYKSIKKSQDCVYGTKDYKRLAKIRDYSDVHDDVIKWKHFPRYWPFVMGIHRSPVNFPHKGQWRGALIFSLIFAWTHGWVNNRESGDLRRHRAHYDVTVMENTDMSLSHDIPFSRVIV